MLAATNYQVTRWGEFESDVEWVLEALKENLKLFSQAREIDKL